MPWRKVWASRGMFTTSLGQRDLLHALHRVRSVLKAARIMERSTEATSLPDEWSDTGNAGFDAAVSQKVYACRLTLAWITAFISDGWPLSSANELRAGQWGRKVVSANTGRLVIHSVVVSGPLEYVIRCKFPHHIRVVSITSRCFPKITPRTFGKWKLRSLASPPSDGRFSIPGPNCRQDHHNNIPSPNVEIHPQAFITVSQLSHYSLTFALENEACHAPTVCCKGETNCAGDPKCSQNRDFCRCCPQLALRIWFPQPS